MDPNCPTTEHVKLGQWKLLVREVVLLYYDMHLYVPLQLVFPEEPLEGCVEVL